MGIKKSKISNCFQSICCSFVLLLVFCLGKIFRLGNFFHLGNFFCLGKNFFASAKFFRLGKFFHLGNFFCLGKNFFASAKFFFCHFVSERGQLGEIRFGWGGLSEIHKGQLPCLMAFSCMTSVVRSTGRFASHDEAEGARHDVALIGLDTLSYHGHRNHAPNLKNLNKKNFTINCAFYTPFFGPIRGYLILY